MIIWMYNVKSKLGTSLQSSKVQQQYHYYHMTKFLFYLTFSSRISPKPSDIARISFPGQRLLKDSYPQWIEPFRSLWLSVVMTQFLVHTLTHTQMNMTLSQETLGITQKTRSPT